ncbi:MAG: glycosyltransferase family 1 protein [Candidatus Microsaccharimonas sossegonensis]|uniref:Glycosyltransferase family 1 protein n=1 Tax=Candidatus Microsaccharimonas sossegonensis TaxID=2506948 RepID=A0A4Q0AGR7_9BACT|nr:MAG: glycosyltransferase family 1 protein [Candidatus Microsaccharimonas sossegonensis]
MKQKLLFVETSALTSKNMSGIGHTLLALLREWHQSETLNTKFKLILLVPYDKRKQVETLGLQFPIKQILIPDTLFRALRRFNLLPFMDIFFGKGYYLFPNYWNWPLLFSKSYTYMYDVSFIVYPEFTDTKNQIFLSRYLKIWAQRSNGIITISNHAKAEIIKYTNMAANKIKVIHNGVNAVPSKAVTNETINAMKKKYGIVGEYILFVGNIEPRKNIARLVAAYRLLAKETRQVYTLVVVGGYGWKNEPIKKSIESAVREGHAVLKIDTFVPDQDIIQLYAGAKVLVHPALYEGFGMTPLEAMSVGTPTIVGNNSSLPEVMSNASLYVDAMSEKDISVKIEKLLRDENLRNKLIKAGKIRVRKFTWRQTVNELGEYMEKG